MKRLQVIDIVAIACELWNCDAATALDRLDLGAIELAVEAAFGSDDRPAATADPAPEAVAGDEVPDVEPAHDAADRAPEADELAVAAATLVAHLLPAKSAGTDTRRHALLTAVCLAGLNGHVLAARAQELADIFDRITEGRIELPDLTRWFASKLAPAREQPPSIADPSETLSPIVRRVLACARSESEQFAHPNIGTEHVLVGILLTGPNAATDLLEVEGVSLDAVRREIVRLVGAGYTPADRVRPLTPRARDILEQARANATLDDPYASVEAWHLLQAIVADGSGLAAKILARLSDLLDSSALWSEPETARVEDDEKRRLGALKRRRMEAADRARLRVVELDLARRLVAEKAAELARVEQLRGELADQGQPMPGVDRKQAALERAAQGAHFEQVQRGLRDELEELQRRLHAERPDAPSRSKLPKGRARDLQPPGPTPTFAVVHETPGSDHPWLAEAIRKQIHPLAPGAIVTVRQRNHPDRQIDVLVAAPRQPDQRVDQLVTRTAQITARALVDRDTYVDVRVDFFPRQPKLAAATSVRTGPACAFCRRRIIDRITLVAAADQAICNLCLSAALAAIDDELGETRGGTC